jgi:hypothetical protein
MFNKSRKRDDMAAKVFQPVALEHETRAGLPTVEAAHHLCRAQQTLRLWAMRQDGPIAPHRVNGRLHWPTAEIRKLLGVKAA